MSFRAPWLYLLILFAGMLALMPVQSAYASSSVQKWLSYTQDNSTASFQEIQAFLKSHPDWPSLKKIQANTERAMQADMNPADIIEFFKDRDVETLDGAKLYANALLGTGQQKQASDFLNSWWGEASLSRSGQKEFFTLFEKYLKRPAHIKRLHMLLDSGSFENAQGMAAILGADYQKLAKARIALRGQKGNVTAAIDAAPASLKNDPGLKLDRLTWRRKKDLDSGALSILQKAPSFEQMRRAKSWWRERHILVRRLMEDKNYKRAYVLASAHRQKEGFPMAQAEWVSGFLALQFLNKNWEAFEHFEKLYHATESPISRARGAYWAGLASERLGHPDVAAQWFEKAATHTETFYGQMAAEKTGQAARVQFTAGGGGSVQPTIKALQASASELGRMKKTDETALFLRHLADISQSAADFKSSAQTASRLGYPHIAIAIVQKAARKGYKMNGLAYPERAHDLRQIRDVEWALIHGLIRQESRFDQYAVSRAGARGLMQLMPATAREAARKMGMRHQKAWLTSKPDHNLKLGSYYIQKMTDRYGGHYAMALAAYNAGPGRVDNWIKIYGDPRTDEIDLITWIELIPIYETRNYVQRVLEAVYVYRQKLKSKQRPADNPIHVAMR